MKRLLLALTFSVLCASAQGISVATINSGQSLSSPVEVRPQGRSGFCTATVLVMPSAWTTADLTFQASIDGQTFGDLYDDTGVEVVVKAAAGRVIVLPAAYFWGLRWLRVRSGTAVSPVAQAASRQLTILCRE